MELKELVELRKKARDAFNDTNILIKSMSSDKQLSPDELKELEDEELEEEKEEGKDGEGENEEKDGEGENESVNKIKEVAKKPQKKDLPCNKTFQVTEESLEKSILKALEKDGLLVKTISNILEKVELKKSKPVIQRQSVSSTSSSSASPLVKSNKNLSKCLLDLQATDSRVTSSLVAMAEINPQRALAHAIALGIIEE